MLRFFNTSGPLNNVVNNPLKPEANTVRATHWEGTCVMGKCQECDPNDNALYTSASPHGAGRTCLNGRIIATGTVDNTIRSLRYNSVASASITIAVFVGVFLVGFYVYTMYDSNRHRALFGKPPLSCMEMLVDTFQFWQCCACCGTAENHRVGVHVRSVGSGNGNGGVGTNNPVADWDGTRRASGAGKAGDSASPAQHPPMQAPTQQQPLMHHEGGYGAVPGAATGGPGFHG